MAERVLLSQNLLRELHIICLWVADHTISYGANTQDDVDWCPIVLVSQVYDIHARQIYMLSTSSHHDVHKHILCYDDFHVIGVNLKPQPGHDMSGWTGLMSGFLPA